MQLFMHSVLIHCLFSNNQSASVLQWMNLIFWSIDIISMIGSDQSKCLLVKTSNFLRIYYFFSAIQ